MSSSVPLESRILSHAWFLWKKLKNRNYLVSLDHWGPVFKRCLLNETSIMVSLPHSGLGLSGLTLPVYVSEVCHYWCRKQLLWMPRTAVQPSPCPYAAHSRNGACRSGGSPREYRSLCFCFEGILEAGVGHTGWGSGTLRGQRLARHGRISDNWHPPPRHLSPSPIPLKTTATKTPFSTGHGGANPLSTKTWATDSI